MAKWQFYTTNELKPRGWIYRQLRMEADGLCGNLDKIWPDVRDSAWLGGSREGWERVPYWLDGFIPLSYLLEDEDMISRAKKYIDAILSLQEEDGWICPCTPEKRKTYDTWAVLLISKVLTVYYESSRDERIPNALYKSLHNFYNLLEKGELELFNWGKFRWFEGFIAIKFLRERYSDEWILKLAKILREQGADYNDYCESWKRPLNAWTFHTHIVNLAMMLKYEAMENAVLGGEYSDFAERLRAILREYNGTPVETFTGDECLSGLSPIQGTELCSVVEQMYSYELLYAQTGDKKWLERLEVLAFNALPATISDDMWSHQYLQQSNQIACITFPGKPLFRTNSSEAHLFGLEPHFGCCTSNFGQGWPKFALCAFMHSKDEIINAVMLPSVLEEKGVKIELETDYPFKNSARYIITAERDFIFKIRIPSFARQLLVNGAPQEGDELIFDIKKGERREINLAFLVTPEFVSRPYNLFAAKCGSLVFAAPIANEKKMLEYERNGVERKYPYCDYELIPKSEWGWAFASDSLKRIEKEINAVPFAENFPPVTLKTEAFRINWGFADGYDSACAKTPENLTPIGEPKELILYPYGCAKLRMTELPKI